MPVILLLLLTTVVASPGDRDPVYHRCRDQCVSANCTALSAPSAVWARPCPAECQHNCSLAITLARVEMGLAPLQYHGKWVFWQIFGVEEPAAALFSFGNLLVHLWALCWCRAVLPAQWLAFAAVSCHAWFWATLFHVRDNSMTETMDYVTAASAVWCWALATALHVAPRGRVRFFLCALAALGYSAHVRVLYPRIDYGMHVKICIAVTVVSLVLWLAFLARHRHARHVWKLALFLPLTGAVSLFETLDIGAWRLLVDGHALWHLGTVVSGALFFSFVCDDVAISTAAPAS
jgi:hypothetical protein